MIVDNELLRRWYRRLSFPSRYDDAFEALLGERETVVGETFGDDAAANILTALYRCELLQARYREHGIDETVLDATLRDIVIWTDTWYTLSGEFGVMEIHWLDLHLSFKLFRLGRLQFCAGKATHAIPEAGVAEGDDILEVHIPADGPMDLEECKASIAEARRFYAKFFPDHHYKSFTCHSWLLDRTLRQFLGEESNIMKFQSLFTIAHDDVADDVLKYIFRWDAKREQVATFEAKTKLAAAVKQHALNGGTFYCSLGWFL